MLAAVRSARVVGRAGGGKRRPASHISSPIAVAAILIAHAVVLTPRWRIVTIPMMSAGSGAQAGNAALTVPWRESICSEVYAGASGGQGLVLSLWSCLRVLAFVAGPMVMADCRCPPGAVSKAVLLTVGTSESGLVACGYEDERQGETVVASEFQVFQCGGTNPLLDFGALQTAVLRGSGAELLVTEVELWPFGEHWKWVRVPVHERRLSVKDPQPHVRRTVTALPEVTRTEIAAFIREYRQWLSLPRATRSYEPVEEYVARLFTAAVAGDRDADALFVSMGEDAGLDGAAAEVYGLAVGTYEEWKPARMRLNKE
jgi:hypothetical protein